MCILIITIFLSKGFKTRYTVSGEKYILNALVSKDTVLKYWLGKGTLTSKIGWSISYIIGQLHKFAHAGSSQPLIPAALYH